MLMAYLNDGLSACEESNQTSGRSDFTRSTSGTCEEQHSNITLD